jgi:23S rRNA U2552 (ribose-2'-O)-methylase RlmE/FtsJ
MYEKEIKSCLSLLKDYIGRHHDEWEVYRVIGNPYDKVYTAPACVSCDGDGGDFRVPASRAFYKLVEIVKTTPFLENALSAKRALRCAYVGEAPGSFVECVVTTRRAAGLGAGDSHTGISLKSDRRSVPHWKLGFNWMQANGVRIHRGADGTGDILKSRNVDAFVEACGGEGSCDIVTGDGGFDFSSDFNDQEAQVLRLLAAQCLVALRLLAPGGCCVIKMFDAFNADTRAVVASFLSCFSEREFSKPRTSRPGNSERYLVCGGFADASTALKNSLRAIATGGSEPRGLPSPPAECLEEVDQANVRFGLMQIESILGTIDCMDREDASDVPDLSREWMTRYLPHHH